MPKRCAGPVGKGGAESAVGKGGSLIENLSGNVPCPLQISAFKRTVVTDTGHFRTRSEFIATHPRRAIRALRVRSLRVPSSQTKQGNPKLTWLPTSIDVRAALGHPRVW